MGRVSTSVQQKSVKTLIRDSAGRSPQAIAIIDAAGRHCSYADLAAHVDNVGRALRGWGIGRGDRVAISLPNGADMATAFLGVAAHAQCAPLNPAYVDDELKYYLDDLDAQAVVVPAGREVPARGVAQALGIRVIDLAPSSEGPAGVFTFHEAPGSVRPMPHDPGHGDDVALVLHTSGTTSRPKQVPLSHTNLCASAANISRALKLGPEDRCLNVMPLFHIHGLVGVLLASLQAGSSVVCAEGFQDSAFAKLMKQFLPTWYSAAPTIHQSVIELAEENPAVAQSESLRFIRSSSSALPPSVMERLENIFGVPVIESYGMTEAAHQMASSPLPPEDRKAGSVGLPAGPEMAVMNEEGKMLSVGETGEIVIRGANVMTGYVGNPEANQAAFTDGWFRTGDLGRRDEDGYYFITGRTKEMINRGGENVSPQEIDEALLEHPSVNQAVAFALPHKTLGEDIAAAVVLGDPEGRVTEQDLRDFLFARLADFKVPSQIVILEQIPKGPTGKVQRIGLGERLKSALQTKHVPPSGAAESKLAALWADLLGLCKIGREDNFFACGGDSLKATRLTARIRESFQVDLKPSDIFLQPVLHAQAKEVAAAMDRRRIESYRGIEAVLDELDGMSDEEAERILVKENNER